MNYRKVLIYHISGIKIRDEKDIVLVNNQSNKVILTNQVDKYTDDIDFKKALGTLMLSTLTGKKNKDGNQQDQLNRQIEKIRKTRSKKFNDSFLIIESCGETEEFNLSNGCHETENYVVCIKNTSPTKLPSVSEKSTMMIIAIIFGGQNSTENIGIEKIADDVIYFRKEDDKPLYVIIPNISASGTVIKSIKSEVKDEVYKWYEYLEFEPDLKRSYKLFHYSLENQQDTLRAFIYSWSALEIFINKVFSQYQDRLFEKLRSSDNFSSYRNYFNKVKNVMNDKHNLLDKFSVISANLCSFEQNDDYNKLRNIKSQRDELFHGQDTSENYDVSLTQEMFTKYLRLHLEDKIQNTSD